MGNLSQHCQRADWSLGYVVNESGNFGIPESHYEKIDIIKAGLLSAFKRKHTVCRADNTTNEKKN